VADGRIPPPQPGRAGCRRAQAAALFSGAAPPGRRAPEVPARAVVLPQPGSESQCYPGALVTLARSVAQREYFSAQRVPAFFQWRADAVFPVARYSVSVGRGSGEAQAFLSRRRAPSLSIASAQYSVMRKGQPNHLPDSTFLLLYSSCSPSLDDILA